ncbi:major facilitator superfamily domain-containing protein [Mycena floridula]|nr:major facilitator superfamily domain-containing protein [Mycena floridula]
MSAENSSSVAVTKGSNDVIRKSSDEATRKSADATAAPTAAPSIQSDKETVIVQNSPPGIVSDSKAEVDTFSKVESLSKPEATDSDAIVYPSGVPLILITIGLCLAVFVVALDNSIIATAIPTITVQFNSLSDVGWYGSSYLLTLTSLQPSFGKIYTNFDLKYSYLVALVIFEIGSIICAVAVNSTMLIVGRAIAGIGASGLFSGALIIISNSVRIERRAVYIAAVSSMFGIASVVGPLLGGVFTDKVTWRWCFWINLPFGAVAFLAVFFFFKSPESKSRTLSLKEKMSQIDILGAALLVGGIICLLLALQWGGSVHPWKSSKIWGLFLGFGLLIIAFIVVQVRRGHLATIPLPILKQRTVLVSSLFTMFFGMALYIHIFYLPFYFQAIKGTSAVGSGIRSIPYLVSITLSSIVIGGVITVTGNYADPLWVGSLVFIAGCVMIWTLKVSSSTGMWLGYELLAGIGAGVFQIPFMAVQVVLSQADTPVGTSLVMFFNSLGGAVSISIAQNIFSNELVKAIPKYAPEVDASLVLSAGATHLREVVSVASLPGVLEAYAKSLQKTFIPPIAFAAATFFIAIAIQRVNVKGRDLITGGA